MNLTAFALGPPYRGTLLRFLVISILIDRLRPGKSEGKLLLEQEFTCLIDKATRTEQKGSITTSTLIDILLTNKPDQFKCGGIYHPSLNDHALIYGILKEKLPRQHSKLITFRSYKNFDCDKFTQDLPEAPWHVGEIFDDLDDQVHYWNTLLTNIIDENLPSKKMKVRAEDVPYMTTNWKNAIRAKRKALANYYWDKSNSNWDKLRKCRNEATRQRRRAIKSYWRKKSNHLKENPADFYRPFMLFLSSKASKKKLPMKSQSR